MTQPKNAEILDKARAIFKARGMNSHQRAQEKIALSTAWIYRNGYTSPDLLSRFLNVKSRPGIAANLVKWGLAKSTHIQGGGVVRGVPQYVVTLTKSGVSEALNHIDIPLTYVTSPRLAINRSTIEHDMIVQHLTVGALNSGGFDGYFSEREIIQLNTDEVQESRSNYSVKIPDALWFKGQNRTAIELELSPKWDRKLDRFVEGLLIGMDKKRWEDVIVFAKSNSTATRYSEAVSVGAEIPHWKLFPSNRWGKTGSPRVVTRAEAARFSFLMLGN